VSVEDVEEQVHRRDVREGVEDAREVAQRREPVTAEPVPRAARGHVRQGGGYLSGFQHGDPTLSRVTLHVSQETGRPITAIQAAASASVIRRIFVP